VAAGTVTESELALALLVLALATTGVTVSTPEYETTSIATAPLFEIVIEPDEILGAYHRLSWFPPQPNALSINLVADTPPIVTLVGVIAVTMYASTTVPEVLTV
jgi:hypothetical protein